VPSEREFNDGFFDLIVGDGGFHLLFNLLFTVALYHDLGEYDLVFVGGFEFLGIFSVVSFSDVQGATNIFQVLSRKFQRPVNTRAADFDAIGFA
jgi:hypothetical protein